MGARIPNVQVPVLLTSLVPARLAIGTHVYNYPKRQRTALASSASFTPSPSRVRPRLAASRFANARLAEAKHNDAGPRHFI